MKRASAFALGLCATLAPIVAHAQDSPPPARTISERLASEALRNRIGDPDWRRVVVHLPPSYYSTPSRRYPMVVLLHAFDGSPSSWFAEGDYEGLDVAYVLDSLVGANAAPEMILVMPDVSNRFGGSWLANSASGGRWEDFIARDLVSFTDARYRTIPDRRARAIVGHAMGAYGAMRLASHRPDVFGAAVIVSPPMVRDPNPFGEPAMEAALASMSDGVIPEEDAVARLTLAKAVAFSPDGSRPPFFAALPWVWRDDRLVRDDAVWDMWTRATLLGGIGRASPSLADVRVRLEVGVRDPGVEDVAVLARALEATGAKVDLVTFDGDHSTGIRAQFETSIFKWLGSVLSRR